MRSRSIHQAGIPSPFIFIVILILIGPSRAYPFTFTTPSLSITQWYRYPPEFTDVRFSVISPLIFGNLVLRDLEDLQTVEPEIRTWNIRLKPFRYLALFGGSISGTGLASRVKNPVAPCSSPVFRTVHPSRGMILRPGSSLETGFLGAEVGPPPLRIALMASPDQTADTPGWACVSSSIPDLFPAGFGYSLSLFAGMRHIGSRDDTAWFLPSTSIPEAHLLFPAAELILFNRLVSASCSAFGNIGNLRETKGAVHADLGITWKFLSLGGAWYRADRDFMDFNGSMDTIMERKLIAPGLLVPFPGSSRFKLQVHFVAAEDLLLVKKFNAADDVRRYYGLQVIVGDTSCKLKASVEKADDGITIGGSVKAFRLFNPSLQLEISGTGYIPDSGVDIGLMEDTQFKASLVWKSAKRFHLELTGARSQEKIDDSPEYRAALLGSGTLYSGRHVSVFASAELSRGSEPESDFTRLYLKTAFNK